MFYYLLQKVDELELTSLDQVYCKDRQKPLLIGSVKSIAGHSEASADMVSLAKVLIAMDANKVPANLHFDKPNPNIAALAEGRMKVVTENMSWNGKYAAINSVGLSSSYGHILLKANSKMGKEVGCKFAYMVPVSASTEKGVNAMMNTVSLIKKVYRN